MLEVVFYETERGNSPVEEFLQEQDAEVRAVILESIRALCEEFPTVATVSIKHLRGKVWEIRLSAEKKAYRILYGVAMRDLLLLHAFVKKTQKTPDKEIDLAVKRFKQVTE